MLPGVTRPGELAGAVFNTEEVKHVLQHLRQNNSGRCATVFLLWKPPDRRQNANRAGAATTGSSHCGCMSGSGTALRMECDCPKARLTLTVRVWRSWRAALHHSLDHFAQCVTPTEIGRRPAGWWPATLGEVRLPGYVRRRRSR